MATKRNSQTATATTTTSTTAKPMQEWMAQAAADGVKPEQALAFIGLGLMQKMAAAGQDLPWSWNEGEDGGQADLAALRQRLELIQLAIQTSAPLSTAEVSHLLGARPGTALVERGGLLARRVSRNVWKLSRSSDDGDRGASNGFGGDGFRRRL
ncbi:hypothetical protein [Cyanobium sp. HWJ4-Hawea]|uniref:hypothetical protein n=1 Tax=Cyanobium sp. HWJ4-Hawea TaxID=2823713 RepID=UPI0039657E28